MQRKYAEASGDLTLDLVDQELLLRYLLANAPGRFEQSQVPPYLLIVRVTTPGGNHTFGYRFDDRDIANAAATRLQQITDYIRNLNDRRENVGTISVPAVLSIPEREFDTAAFPHFKQGLAVQRDFEANLTSDAYLRRLARPYFETLTTHEWARMLTPRNAANVEAAMRCCTEPRDPLEVYRYILEQHPPQFEY